MKLLVIIKVPSLFMSALGACNNPDALSQNCPLDTKQSDNKATDITITRTKLEEYLIIYNKRILTKKNDA